MTQLTVVQIASIIHDANRAYCAAIGDSTASYWVDAPQWQRESMIAGVSAMLDGSAKTPREQHEAWRAYKIADSWIFGATKDPVMKTHPCLVPYDELPDEQKRKDYLSRAIVGALTSALTFTGTIAGGLESHTHKWAGDRLFKDGWHRIVDVNGEAVLVRHCLDCGLTEELPTLPSHFAPDWPADVVLDVTPSSIPPLQVFARHRREGE